MHGNTEGNMNFFPAVFSLAADFLFCFIKPSDKFIFIIEITAFHDNGEFITADPENRRVLKDSADQAAGCFEINVPFVMSVSVVDALEIITIKNADRKVEFFTFIDP